MVDELWLDASLLWGGNFARGCVASLDSFLQWSLVIGHDPSLFVFSECFIFVSSFSNHVSSSKESSATFVMLLIGRVYDYCWSGDSFKPSYIEKMSRFFIIYEVVVCDWSSHFDSFSNGFACFLWWFIEIEMHLVADLRWWWLFQWLSWEWRSDWSNKDTRGVYELLEYNINAQHFVWTCRLRCIVRRYSARFSFYESEVIARSALIVRNFLYVQNLNRWIIKWDNEFLVTSLHILWTSVYDNLVP